MWTPCGKFALMNTSAKLNPPRARKYHAFVDYSHGKWPTVSLPFNSLMANCQTDYQTLFEQHVFLQQMAPIHLYP